MRRNSWHYPRREFAEKVYNYLALGPIQGVKIFGPRRIGKTEFLSQDLAPLVEERGHRVVYANLWQRDVDPLATLLYAFDQTLRGGSIFERLKSAIDGISPKIRLKIPGSSAELEVDTGHLKKEAPTALLFMLDEYCELLSNVERPAFLLLDEFQELRNAPFANSLVAALRAGLDKRQDSLVAVFTGSSQDELIRIFGDDSSPFFAFAGKLDLPPLTEEFVDHQLDHFRSISRVAVERRDALEVFHRFNENPMILQQWLMNHSIYPDVGKDEAVAQVLDNAVEALGFRKIWIELGPVERIAARLLADRKSVLGKDGSNHSHELTGRGGNSLEELKSAVDRLYALRIAERNNGDWVIGDELVERWIKNRPKFEF